MKNYEFLNPFWEPIKNEVEIIYLNTIKDFDRKKNKITREEYAIFLMYFTFYVMKEPFHIFNMYGDDMINENSIINYIKSLPPQGIFESEIEIIIIFMFIITKTFQMLSHEILNYYHQHICSYLFEKKYFINNNVINKFENIIQKRYSEYYELTKKLTAGEEGNLYLKCFYNIFKNRKNVIYDFEDSLLLGHHFISIQKLINETVLPKYRIKGLNKYFIIKGGKTYFVNEENE